MKLPKQPQSKILEQLDLIQRFNDAIARAMRSNKDLARIIFRGSKPI